jgi:hypothetical protein
MIQRNLKLKRRVTKIVPLEVGGISERDMPSFRFSSDLSSVMRGILLPNGDLV